jgi:two-component system LytT family response regulator
MLNVLILEDEVYTLRFLQAIVSEHPLVKNVFGASTGRDAVQLAQEHKPEVTFLDIELSPKDDYTGLEVASHIAKICPDTRFVFVTGYEKYALDSFSVHPYDYVLKPVKKDRLFDTLTGLAKDLMHRSQTNLKRIIVQNGQEMIFLAPSEIFFFEKKGRKTMVHTRNGLYEVGKSLNILSESLSPEFIRTHKSFIININRIRKVIDLGNRTWEVTFQGYDKSALLSRHRYDENKDLFTSPL